jgi:phosphoribosylformylglycinamidine synthase
LGARVVLAERMRPDALLFGEATGRVIATTAQADALLEAARRHGVPARTIGTTGGARLAIVPEHGAPWIDVAVAQLHAVWKQALPRRMEVA